MKRIAIIGGGISGLSAAFALEQQRGTGAPLEYVLYESSARPGGVLRSELVDGCVVEAGPDSFLTEKPWAADLCRQLGIGDQLIGSNDAKRKTYILLKNKLIPLPDGLMFMVPTKILPVVFSPLFPLRTKLRMAREWFSKPRTGPDEPVAALVERHYGPEMVHRLADPLLSGVYGGAAAQLGVRAVLPRFAEMEAKYGSLGKGMLASRKHVAKDAAARPLFTSLKHGMQQLVDALVPRLDPRAIRVNLAVQGLQAQNGSWTVFTGSGAEHFDALIVAIPAPSAGLLLQGISMQPGRLQSDWPTTAPGDLAAELRGIAYTSSCTVTLGYDERVRALLPPGFGFLIPRSEGRRMLAVTFVHNKFPFRAPDDRALIRCFLGGAHPEPVINFSEEEIVRIVRDELRQILGITVEPNFTRVYKWKSAMAQYNVGHIDRVERIERLTPQLPGLVLAGNGYRGIGVPDCVCSGQSAAAQVLEAMGMAPAKPEAVSQ
jgi:oxygen-dependent protoporphyrinogen oxidase